jgi:hypothetical protein
VKFASLQFRAALNPHQTPPASDFVFAGERPSSLAAPISCSYGGKNLQGRFLLEDMCQSLLRGAIGLAG